MQCILDTQGGEYAQFDGCDLNNQTTWTINSYDNKVYVPGANATVECGPTITFQEWQQKTGRDKGTTLNGPATSAQIIGWAQALLGF